MIPADIGAPSRYTSYRPQQLAALEHLVSSEKRIDVGALPVGVGKSLLAGSYARLFNQPTVILTQTKGLQDQYDRDLPDWVYDVRGMSSYPCRKLDKGYGWVPGCDAGPCLDGEFCQWREQGCFYYDKWKAALFAPIVVTNYDAWFAHTPESQYALGSRPLVIADEAHALSDAVVKAVGVKFTHKEVQRVSGMEDWLLDQWVSWAKARLLEAEELLKNPGALTPFERRKLRHLATRFARLSIASEDWALHFEGYGSKWSVQLEPISPAPYVEDVLWRGAERVVLLSGTIRPSHMTELGYDKGSYGFFESKSPFSIKSRPIYRVKLGFRMTANVSDSNKEEQAARIDQVIQRRKHLKGIIHTVSYSRAQYLFARSRFRDKMILHGNESGETKAAVEQFKAAPPGAVLVSPSVHTGYDFPYEDAQYQVIAKIPFPDTRNGLAKARKAADPSWDIRHAIDTMQQAAGRVVRAEDDAGETIIMDDSFDFLWWRHREHFSLWFQEAVKLVDTVPAPLIAIRS